MSRETVVAHINKIHGLTSAVMLSMADHTLSRTALLKALKQIKQAVTALIDLIEKGDNSNG